MANSVRESSGKAPEEIYVIEYTDKKGKTFFRTFKYSAKALVFKSQKESNGEKAVYMRYNLEKFE